MPETPTDSRAAGGVWSMVMFTMAVGPHRGPYTKSHPTTRGIGVDNAFDRYSDGSSHPLRYSFVRYCSASCAPGIFSDSAFQSSGFSPAL
jgi:hypothetical protein